MSLPVPLSPETDFPHEDLDDQTARTLELFLANREILAGEHQKAERSSWVYRVGHMVIRTLACKALPESEQVIVTEYGASIYEAMSSMVRKFPARGDEVVINRRANELAELDLDESGDYLGQSYDRLVTELPRAAEVIQHGSRLDAVAARYALYGAGAIRQFELDVSL